ncbi:hypothetical protein TKK_0010210 [Trichogramma kaykai]
MESIVKFDRNRNYDMMNKKIQNVGEPINDTDAVILRNLHDAEKSLLQSIEKIPRGPPGYGYKATSDGNYDLMQKRLTNTAHPIDDMDAVTLWVMNFYMDDVRSKAQREIDDVSSKLQQSVSDMSRMFYESVENVKKSIDLIKKKSKELEKLLDRQSDEKDLIKRNPEFHYLHRVYNNINTFVGEETAQIMMKSLQDVSCDGDAGIDTCGPFTNSQPKPESLIHLPVHDEDNEVTILKRLNDVRLAQVKHFDMNSKRLTNLADGVEVSDLVNLNVLTNGITSIFIKMNDFMKTAYMKISSLLKQSEKGDFNIEAKLLTNVEDASLDGDVVNLIRLKDFVHKMEKVIESTEPGPQGEGHDLAEDTYNYDLNEKRMKNVADHMNSFDFMNYRTLRTETQKEFDAIKHKQEKLLKTVEKELRALFDKSTSIISQLKLEVAVIDERYTNTSNI